MLQAFLMALALPLVKRVLVGLGIGVITYTGTTALLDVFVTSISDNVNSMPVVVLQMCTLFGFTDSLGILLGELSTRASISAFKRMGIL